MTDPHITHTTHIPHAPHAPHTYVFYTLSGQEEEMVKILKTTELIEEPPEDKIPPSMECVFIPKAEFHRRRGGEDFLTTKNLYSGYIFFQTQDPVGFYYRLRDRKFFANYGKLLKMLRRRDYVAPPKNKALNRVTARAVEKNFAEYSELYMGRISDEEEKGVLGYVGLKRSEDGSIVRKNTSISAADEKKLREAGVNVDVFLRMISNSLASPGSPASPGSSGSSGSRASALKAGGEEKKVDLFSATMSHAVKIVKAGTPPTQRNETNSRLVVLDGPLVGSEKNIIHADAHKRTATVRTEFMHAETRITLPLEIMETIEVDARVARKVFR